MIFIHNAATLTPLGPADRVDTEQYTRNVLLNSAAAQVLGHAFLSAVSGRNCEQHLIMVSSGAAKRPHEGESSYCAGKAAIDQWVRTTGLEQRRRDPGCRVISVSPGAIDTDMQAELRATTDEQVPVSNRFREMEAQGPLEGGGCCPEHLVAARSRPRERHGPTHPRYHLSAPAGGPARGSPGTARCRSRRASRTSLPSKDPD